MATFQYYTAKFLNYMSGNLRLDLTLIIWKVGFIKNLHITFGAI